MTTRMGIAQYRAMAEQTYKPKANKYGAKSAYRCVNIRQLKQTAVYGFGLCRLSEWRLLIMGDTTGISWTDHTLPVWFKQWGSNTADKGGCQIWGREIKQFPRPRLLPEPPL